MFSFEENNSIRQISLFRSMQIFDVLHKEHIDIALPPKVSQTSLCAFRAEVSPKLTMCKVF